MRENFIRPPLSCLNLPLRQQGRLQQLSSVFILADPQFSPLSSGDNVYLLLLGLNEFFCSVLKPGLGLLGLLHSKYVIRVVLLILKYLTTTVKSSLKINRKRSYKQSFEIKYTEVGLNQCCIIYNTAPKFEEYVLSK